MPEREIIAKLWNKSQKIRIKYFGIFIKEDEDIEPLGTFREGSVYKLPMWYPIDHRLHNLPVPETVRQMILTIKGRLLEQDELIRSSFG